MLKRLFCLLSAFTVLFFSCAPVFATGTMPGGAGVGIPVVGNINVDVVDLFNYMEDNGKTAWNMFRNAINKDICPNAPRLNGNHKFQPVRTMNHGQIGLYYQCEYCGKNYGEALEEKYDDFLQESFESGSSTKIDSGGNIPMSSSAIYFNRYRGWAGYSTETDYKEDVSLNLTAAKPSSGKFFMDARPGKLLLMGNNADIFLYVGSTDTFLYADFVPPCDGVLVVPPTSVSFSFVGDTGNNEPRRQSFSSDFQGNFPLVSGKTPSVYFSFNLWSLTSEYYFPATWGSYAIPVNSILISADFSGAYIIPKYLDEAVYSAQNRVSGVADAGAMYGYVQDGQLYQSTVGNIYNETSNVYQNPVTGDTHNVSTWNYDYADRSYTLNTEEGDEITVTYGDSNITINEGGNTYNVYYLVEEPDNVVFDPAHTHDYTSEVTQAPTCTASGVRTFTCSGCGDTYTQAIPATGHSYVSVVTMEPSCTNTGVTTFTCSVCGDSYTVSTPAKGHTWQVKNRIATQYDEDGRLLQAGYTLYECFVCGEQYRIDADTGGSSLPAPSSGGTSTGGTGTGTDSSVGRGFLATIAHGLTEDLPEVLQAFSEMFVQFPVFYSGFTGFIKQGILILPEIPQKTVGVGFGFVTAIGIIRRIIGR